MPLRVSGSAASWGDREAAPPQAGRLGRLASPALRRRRAGSDPRRNVPTMPLTPTESTLILERTFELGGWMADHLLRDAQLLPAIVAAGQITDEHAAKVLVSDAGGDLVRLQEAKLQLLDDPDALPAAIALLDRAVHLVEHPPPPRRHSPPDAFWGRYR